MSSHLSTQHVEQYRQRALPEAELLEVDDHLVACEECRQRIGLNVEVDGLVADFHHRLLSTSGWSESDHASYEQLVTLVDGELGRSERETLQTHLEVCPSCKEDLNDLIAFRAELGASPEEKTERAPRASVAEKIRLLINSNRLSFSPAFAGVLAILLIASAIALFFVWRAWTRSQPVLEATHQVPEPLPSIAPANIPTASPQQTLPPDGLVTLNDGGRSVKVGVNGDVEGLGPLPAGSIETVKRALTTGELEVPDLSELTGVKGRLMGTNRDGSTFSLINPVGTVTRNTRPTFRWQPLMGASSYNVAILDGSYNVITTSPSLISTSWTSTINLDRGRIYSWQVTSSKDGKQQVSPAAPEPEARFKVLDKSTEERLSSIEKTTNSHVVRGAMYARAGLLDDAEKELRALVAANPNSQIAKKLLSSVRAKRRQ